MGMDDPGNRLHLLQEVFIQHPARGLQERGPAAIPCPAPLSLGMIDHIVDSVSEVKARVKADGTQTLPVPADVAGIYDWWRASTPDLDEDRTQVREAIIYRQGLEHAIQAGDRDIVCKHPCPGCGCWGLVWQSAQKRAACLNRDCVDKDGAGNTWPLKRLAYEHIAQSNILKVHAT
jgi:hypothetical protein